MVFNNPLHRKKNWILSFGMVLILIALSFRLGYLMVIKSDYYSQKATDLQQRERKISGIRGDILDRNGVILATSQTCYSVWVIHNQIEDKEAVIDLLSDKLSMDEDTVRQKVEKVSALEKIRGNVSKETGDQIISAGLSGIKVDESNMRYYPNDTLASKVLGFAGGDGQGIVGLESVYDQYLQGKDGKILTTTDARGLEVENYKEIRIAPEKGNTLITTIDCQMQEICMEKAKKAYFMNQADSVSIIAMNPQNGEIYSMVDYPEYNLNDPFENEDYEASWRNFCISDTYEPGSVFKTVTTSIALEENLVSLDESFYCPGYILVEDRRIHCHKRTGHGSETFTEGICNSCNPVFISLGLRIGSDRYYDYFEKYKILEKTGVDLPGEASTIMHDRDKIGQVELATISFGQSFQVTPIQMLTTVSTLINGGNRVTPHFGKSLADSNGNVVEEFEYDVQTGLCSQESSDTLKSLLEEVVSVGSGKNAAVEGYSIGGKTATSQTFPRSDNKYIASFLGFYPADDPQVILIVIINNPKAGQYYGGTIAAPIASEIFQEIIPCVDSLRNEN